MDVHGTRYRPDTRHDAVRWHVFRGLLLGQHLRGAAAAVKVIVVSMYLVGYQTSLKGVCLSYPLKKRWTPFELTCEITAMSGCFVYTVLRPK